MKAIDRRLLSILVDVVWQTSNKTTPLSPALSREMIKEAIEKRRREKYEKIMKLKSYN